MKLGVMEGLHQKVRNAWMRA